MSKTGTAYIDHITEDGIAVLIIDYYPVNALSAGLTNGVKTVMRQLEEDNLPTLHLVSIGGWNGPHPDNRA